MSKKQVVKEVATAFLNADVETALTYMTDDVKMGWPGYFDLAPGKQAVREFFNDIPDLVSGSTQEFIEDGNTVAACGTVTSREKDGTLKNSFFCDLYEFEDSKVKRIKSYMVFQGK
ncbi:MAG TPA: nuclear transport factor 2 family protein [Flavitalea sp.]|nr:nuclear transport factor 2 family protein [Flavitalea sp.]